MLNFYKKMLAMGVLFISSVALAQNTDIPLSFDDEEEVFQENDHFEPTSKPIVQKTEKKETLKLSQEPTIPNLGRNAIPLDSLRLTPNPLPDIRIDLTDDKEEVKVVETKKELSPPIRLDTNILAKENPNNMNGVISKRDVRDFELDHFYLGMTPVEVGQIALENGYKISRSKKELPLFITTRYEQECRSSGVYIPTDLRSCIKSKSVKNKTVFLKEMTISKGKNERLHFEFTSLATGNQVWRITYINKGDNSLNFTQVNTVKKLNRRDGFISAVLNKFGNPDDPKNYIWGDKNDAYMQISVFGTAYDAKITLTDMALSDEDYFEAKNWLEDNPPHEKFDF